LVGWIMQTERVEAKAKTIVRIGEADRVSAIATVPSTPPCPTGCIDCQHHLTRPCCILFEVTQRCNLKCAVCYADAGREPRTDPSLATIAHWYDELKRQAGICHIQLSGGEPTLRDDLDEIIRLGVKRGFEYFQLNTNGLRLAAEPQLAQHLKEAGLTCVFLQFDGVDDRVYKTLRGSQLLSTKERAIAACAQAALPVVLVPTVVRGVNDDQLNDIVRFGVRHSPVVRGVHFQPATLAGRWQLDGNPLASIKAAGAVPGIDRHISIPQLLAELQRQSASSIRIDDFSGGAVEHERCSFNANYYIDEEGQLRRTAGDRQTSFCCGDAQVESVVPESSCCGAQSAPSPPEDSCCCGSDSDGVARAQDIQRRRWGTRLEYQLDTPPTPGTLDEAYWRATTRAFSLTGMAFMDAQTLDMERLRRCYIFIMSPNTKLIPFCAYNLTDAQGQALYRNQHPSPA
jgi:uncharacterized radical SAM superfamily Fe-S cluster-containing enzyme